MTEKQSSRLKVSTKPAAGRPYHHGNLRDAIVSAALDVLGHREPSELSLRDLARSVGVGHSALYSHFRDRGELLAVIAGEGFRALLFDLKRALESSSRDPLAGLTIAYLNFARSNPAHYRAMFRPESAAPENAKHVDDWCGECFQTLILALQAQKHLSDDQAYERAIGIWSTLHGLALLGDDAGPLRRKVSKEREAALALNFTDLLAGREQ